MVVPKQKMKRLVWDDSKYNIGIAKIDLQHKQLFALINALAGNRSGDRAFISRILGTLVLYTKTHFKEEEKMLFKMSYPGLKAHTKNHAAFVNQIISLKAEFEKNRQSQVILEKLYVFLSEWLSNHILKEDILRFFSITS